MDNSQLAVCPDEHDWLHTDKKTIKEIVSGMGIKNGKATEGPSGGPGGNAPGGGQGTKTPEAEAF